MLKEGHVITVTCIFAMYVSSTMIVLIHTMSREKTGGVRLAKMLRGGQINEPYLWIDTYNQCVNKVAGTIKARIDTNCMYFVTVEK